ncbi:hypothetical protein [Pantanalinema sp. GBBB05]|uniref:hypothetical protein n=1 Tax=Pantanalinema sp. GBBB05 TaxID=2604139 RepID=UPI001D3C0186|nr:hypothetical protein [Pantanalinema sp. GBBB05]
MRAFLLVIGALLALGISGFVGFLVGATGGSLAGTWGGANLGICETVSSLRKRQHVTEAEAQKLLNEVLEDSSIYPNNTTRKNARLELANCITKKLKSHETATDEAEPEKTVTQPEQELEPDHAHDRNEPKGELSLPEQSNPEEKLP